ncbi:hypothetical protein HMPREF0602_2346 [Neisseria meningitidis ATCC 13091]|uniref:Uncharacterized protein n=1 Tax=Neisseria meningitidis serogroup B (strain ATCC 13091 / M2091) TaxID=862513 RepID=E0NCW4_NEIM3|nr:hypothetical protein HMPREF0602_2346 [Neisseria meningitidis ATCC 13091]
MVTPKSVNKISTIISYFSEFQKPLKGKYRQNAQKNPINTITL